MDTKENAFLKVLINKISNHNDQKAFEILFKTYFKKLVYFSKNYVSEEESAEEIVSEVFVKVWKNRTQLSKIKNIESYLFVATKNQALNTISQKTKNPHYSINGYSSNSFTSGSNPLMEVEYRELQNVLSKEVEKLPFQSKMVFKLIREDGLKYKQVAEILNISVRTVETQLVRAIKKLEKAVDRYFENDKGLKKSTITLSLLFFLIFFIPL